MKAILIIILLAVVSLGALAGWRYYNAGLEVQAMQEESERKDHQMKVMMGDTAPVYVITAQGKTWESKEKPVTTDYGITFVDSTTGDSVRLSGPVAVELK